MTAPPPVGVFDVQSDIGHTALSYIGILILRRLRSGPAHGYELRKRVEETTGFVLHNNSLYPALRRFEEAGAVTKTTEPQEGRPPRLVYTLTDVGRDLLHDMLADLPAERAGILASRTRAVRDQLAHYRTMHRLATGHGISWGALVTAELIRRHEQELTWLAELGELAQEEP